MGWCVGGIAVCFVLLIVFFCFFLGVLLFVYCWGFGWVL